MYHNFSNNISISVTTEFSERIIDIENDYLIWNYVLNIKNFTDTHLRITGINFSIIDELGQNSKDLYEKINDNNVVIKPNKTIERQGIIKIKNHSAIVFGKIFAFDELDKDLILELPMFSLDSPYYYYKSLN